MPRQNARNVTEDLQDELRRNLIVHYVDEMDEVLQLALVDPATAAAESGRARASIRRA